MLHQIKSILLGTTLAAGLLATSALGQTPSPVTKNAFGTPDLSAREDAGSALDCTRPEEAKEAKVIDFDPTTSVARLAVNLGSGRFTLVTIKSWERVDDTRPLNPVLRAAQIMQGKLQFFSRGLTSNPASAPDEYLIMTEMGGGYVCWAKPSWLIQPANAPVAEASPATKPVSPAALATPAAAGTAATARPPANQPEPQAATRARRAIDAAREVTAH